MSEQVGGTGTAPGQLSGTLPLIVGTLILLVMVFVIALNNSQKGFTGSGSTTGYLDTTTSIPAGGG